MELEARVERIHRRRVQRVDARALRRLDALKCVIDSIVRSLRATFDLLWLVGLAQSLTPIPVGPESTLRQLASLVLRPRAATSWTTATISLDIGLIDRRGVFASGLIFQVGDKLAEGGQYDQLLVTFRRPEAQRRSRALAAVGVRFVISRLARRVPEPAAPVGRAHPLQVIVGSAEDLVPSSTGLAERFLCASYFWSAGIAADYILPYNERGTTIGREGMYARTRTGVRVTYTPHSDMLQQLCRERRVTYLVIVKPHLLRQNHTVKLISILDHQIADEQLALADAVARVTLGIAKPSVPNAPSEKSTDSVLNVSTDPGGGKGEEWNLIVISNTNAGSGNSGRRNSHKDTNSAVPRRVSAFMHRLLASADTGDSPTVLAAEIPFAAIREVGTWCQLSAGDDAKLNEIVDRHAKFRRALLQLVQNLNELSPVQGANRSRPRRSDGKNVFVYSITDDRYDLVSLTDPVLWKGGGGTGTGAHSTDLGSKRDRKSRGGRDRGSNR